MTFNDTASFVFLPAIFLAPGCTTTSQQQLLTADESQVQLRSIQTRAFDTVDKEKTMRTIISTLQDLDFVIDKADLTAGVVTGTKFDDNTAVTITVTVQPRGTTQMLVRAEEHTANQLEKARLLFEAAMTQLEKLDNKVADDLNLAWHRIDTWPDVVPGFVRLKRKFMLAPCSNANIALMVDVARRNNIPWDAILGSEIARDFKPKPVVYLATAAALNLRPEEVMMVAAHSEDLRSAASNGLRTAHVARPGENGPGTGESAPRVLVDFAAKNMEDLARQLGV